MTATRREIACDEQWLPMPLTLVDSIRRAVKDDRLAGLAATMTRLHDSGILENPDFYLHAHADRYSRNLIWSDPQSRFVVVGMTWAPGQMSRLHDHDGLWGAEIVVSGTMHETAYRLVDRDRAGRCSFVREDSRIASKGAVSVLSPPHEYHTFGNAGPTAAQTLHVYCGAMAQCNVFAPDRDGWWKPARTLLHYDA